MSRMWCFVSLTTFAGNSRAAAALMYVLSLTMIGLIAASVRRWESAA